MARKTKKMTERRAAIILAMAVQDVLENYPESLPYLTGSDADGYNKNLLSAALRRLGFKGTADWLDRQPPVK